LDGGLLGNPSIINDNFMLYINGTGYTTNSHKH